MNLYLFNKGLPAETPAALIARAAKLNLAGYHLCVRPGYLLTPENVGRQLTPFVAELRQAGLEVPMLTTRGDLFDPAAPEVIPLLDAMAANAIPRLKIGYFRAPRNTPLSFDAAVSSARRHLEGWQKLGQRFGVTVCCHTHASCGDYFIGSNASALRLLLQDADPRFAGMYLDTAHLSLEGEPFDLAVAIAGRFLAGVAVKDARWSRPSPSAEPEMQWSTAGDGMVDWGCVKRTLQALPTPPPVTIHAEYAVSSPDEFLLRLPTEVEFFTRLFTA